jgi:hypothetical protein
MIFRRIKAHVEKENWFAVGTDFCIVVIGVFIGIQVANWNEARADQTRRSLIVEALINDITDHIAVQNRFVSQIDSDFATWEAAYKDGLRPEPVIFRIEGSDYAPDTWGTLRQMPVTELFDPRTAVMLSYYYSELAGLSIKYVRYVSFVESDILPMLYEGHTAFYTEEGELKPQYRANMDRLHEQRNELVSITAWAECLLVNLKKSGRLSESCSRSQFGLDTPLQGTEAP